MRYSKHIFNHGLNLFLMAGILFDLLVRNHRKESVCACSLLKGDYAYRYAIELFVFKKLFALSAMSAADLTREATGQSKINFSKVLLSWSIKNCRLNDARYFAASAGVTLTRQDYTDMLFGLVVRHYFCRAEVNTVKELLRNGATPPAHDEIMPVLEYKLLNGDHRSVSSLLTAMGMNMNDFAFNERECEILALAGVPNT